MDVAFPPQAVAGVVEQEVILATTLTTQTVINDFAGCEGSSASSVAARPEFDLDDEH